MFLGHFAIGVATKPAAPKLPIWILFLAPQFMDLIFIPLVALGIEGFQQGSYGHDQINALYTHSLVGALIIAGIAYWIGNRFWPSDRGGIILGGLSFSHWVIDLFVHHQDMPLLPGNAGNFPMLGFGLWDYEYVIFGIEVLLAIVGVVLYYRWAQKERVSTRWYLGPAVIALLFVAQIFADIPRLPAF
ncbi:MAG: hypothetical protein R3A44_33970 [Caldilineaceae bacterium]